MSTNNVLHYNSKSETNHSGYYKNTEIIADYAYVLKEKVLLERAKSVLEVTCKDKDKRLNEALEELFLAKKKIESNEEIIDTLQQQLKANLEHMRNEKQVFQVINEQREALVSDLQQDIKDIRKKYIGAATDLERAFKQSETFKAKCKEYKDKLRGFAILFTYFNDPQREIERSPKDTTTASVATAAEASQISMMIRKASSVTKIKQLQRPPYEHDKKILSELFFKHAFDDYQN